MIGDNFSSKSTERDMWVGKTNEDGVRKWNQNFGGSEKEYLGSYCFSQDNHLVLAGSSGEDMWIVKSEKHFQMTTATITTKEKTSTTSQEATNSTPSELENCFSFSLLSIG